MCVCVCVFVVYDDAIRRYWCFVMVGWLCMMPWWSFKLMYVMVWKCWCDVMVCWCEYYNCDGVWRSVVDCDFVICFTSGLYLVWMWDMRLLFESCLCGDVSVVYVRWRCEVLYHGVVVCEACSGLFKVVLHVCRCVFDVVCGVWCVCVLQWSEVKWISVMFGHVTWWYVWLYECGDVFEVARCYALLWWCGLLMCVIVWERLGILN